MSFHAQPAPRNCQSGGPKSDRTIILGRVVEPALVARGGERVRGVEAGRDLGRAVATERDQCSLPAGEPRPQAALKVGKRP